MAHDVDAPMPCTSSDSSAIMDVAETLAAQSGQRLTPIRRKVLQLLVEADGPSKAYDLIDRLDGEGAAKPPTIYRALEFLMALGVVHKIESLNAYVACGDATHHHSAVFLICESCSNVIELHSDTAESVLKTESTAAGFKLKQAVIEARGICEHCSA